ncbi:DUF202 domain-containing protein [Gloeocapsopsis crepidinum LEGE 06123]|uniref:DUF202 domain-containing protein n=1 Tax=Gloeocapsopsis crepidinum LEGE 06123 TaxID=588587 RepID=A0ABR9V0Z3_9CHRO|nr:DUF202 domain-containing protein [Gloeocapsopsis crepidinum]MBE9193480.1 DUF202 domain-containing protein [Gloeocapsopsis crepidinum LEGE 06123]
MQVPQSSGQSSNSNTELAKKRNRAAAERTLMAWIRTNLALISFGFGIDQIVAALNSAVNIDNPIRLSWFLGLSFIALGTGATLAVAVQHRQELRHIQKEHYTYVPERSISLIVASVLFGIGLLAFVGILLKAWD